jgi:hypothetical protein
MIEIDKILTISDKDKRFFKARLSARKEENAVKMYLFSDEINPGIIEGSDFWHCLLKLRQLLEQEQLFILCQGSARNVYLSRMTRDMSDGLKGYALELGKKATLNQLVEIFDPISVEAVGLIAEQNAFFEQWRNSPKV